MSGWYVEKFSKPKREIVKTKTENSIEPISKKSFPLFASQSDSNFTLSINHLSTSSLPKQKTDRATDKKEEGKFLSQVPVVSKEVKEVAHEKQSKKSEKIIRATESNAGLSIFGWVLVVLGFIVLLFASILGGILVMGLGLIFIIAAAPKNKDSNTERKRTSSSVPTYEDVVYLKNGGILRGIIIETIPNVSIKIQTRDKNVFVLKMEEIEKITKEEIK